MGSISGQSLADFRAAVETYFDAMMALGNRLLGPLALCLGLSPAALRARYRKPVAFMRLFHYPPNSNVAQNEFGAAEHKDYGFLTILAQRIRPEGSKCAAPRASSSAAPPRRSNFIVNAGDMLSEITAGRIRSAPRSRDRPRRRWALLDPVLATIPISMRASTPCRNSAPASSCSRNSTSSTNIARSSVSLRHEGPQEHGERQRDRHIVILEILDVIGGESLFPIRVRLRKI